VIRTIGLLALLAMTTPVQAEDFPYDNFARSTLAAITGEWNESLRPGAKPGSVMIIASIQRNVVHVVYTGEHRPVDAATADFIVKYQAAVNAQNDLASLYRDEYRFSENGRDEWLPVQAPVAEYFAGELKPGDEVDLYVIAAGGVREVSDWKWVLTVEEFDSGKRAPR
jgi:hypothetical protein